MLAKESAGLEARAAAVRAAHEESSLESMASEQIVLGSILKAFFLSFHRQLFIR